MKRNYSHITSLEALKAEQLRLRFSYQHQEEMLRENVSAYIRQFSPLNLFKKYFNRESFNKLDDKVNFSGKVMSVILPFLLNKTLFKGSGFITRTAVALVSNKLGKKLDIDHLSGIVDSVKSWFGKRKLKPTKTIDYGIPPDSETY